MLPIDPIEALQGIQKAIKLVKKAAQTAQDVGSLAPMIGKMFDARSTATKAMVEAKKSGKGSNMGTALQMDIEDAHLARQAKEDEKKRKQKEQEQLELTMLIGGIAFVLLLVGIGINELMDVCKHTRCGR